MRRGLVYGLAGALTAYDRASSLAKGAAQGLRDGVNTLREEAAGANANANGHAEAAPQAAAAPKSTAAAAPPG
jgi:hypothetical protein